MNWEPLGKGQELRVKGTGSGDFDPPVSLPHPSHNIRLKYHLTNCDANGGYSTWQGRDYYGWQIK